MRKILLTLLILAMPTMCFADASDETGDTRAQPITCYGIATDNTIVAILVDSDGVVQLTT